MQITVGGTEIEVDLDDVDIAKFSFDEACQIEDWTGWTIAEWLDWVKKGSAKAYRALALALVRRKVPTARDADIAGVDMLSFMGAINFQKDADATPETGTPTPDPSTAASDTPESAV